MTKQVMNSFALSRLELGDLRDIINGIIDRHTGQEDAHHLVMTLDRIKDQVEKDLLPWVDQRKGTVTVEYAQ